MRSEKTLAVISSFIVLVSAAPCAADGAIVLGREGTSSVPSVYGYEVNLGSGAEAEVEARAIVRAAESSPNRMRIAGISVSLGRLMCHVVGRRALRGSWPALNTFRHRPATKSPPRGERGGRYLVEGRDARGVEY